MKKHFGILATSLLIVGTIAVTSSCEQPPVLCTCGRGDFAALYTYVDGGPECGDLKSELLGANAYSPEKDGVNSGSMADWGRSSVAVGSERIGWLIDRAVKSMVSDANPAHKLYSVGDFPKEPSADFCAVPQMRTADAEVDMPAVPMLADDPSTPDVVDPLPPVDATHYKYHFSNMKFLVTPAAIGTQMSADLEYTKNSCTAHYTVKAVYPARNCEKQDEAGHPTGEPDPDRCFPTAQPDKKIYDGSGISPDFPVACIEFDPPTPGGAKRFYCMITKDVPAMK